ncbi:MAG TPA: NAD(P)/FAD-dependent oxidoreductase [Dehalococcoidia bacterium]
MKAVIIGGGVAGLAAAYRLLQRGHRAEVFEAGPDLGGLVRTFQVGGTRLEAFYHHLFKTDTRIIDLIHELGLDDRLIWADSTIGYYTGGRIHNFTTSLDLARFRPLPFADRVRLGLAGLYLRRRADGRAYDALTVKEWWTRHAGRRAYEVVWEPLLRGKFGEAADEISMAWHWSKIRLRFASRRGGPLQREQLGYLLGSFSVYIQELARRLQDGGAAVHTGTPVREVLVCNGRAAGVLLEDGRRVEADAVIAAVPAGVFRKIAPAVPREYLDRLDAVSWQWALCMVLALDRPFSHIYWLNVGDRTLPFLALVEHTNFIDASHYGGNHVLYISNYLPPDHPYLSMGEEELWQLYLPALRRVNPAFSQAWVRDRWLFHGPYAQPVITRGYADRVPPHRTPVPGLYLATMSQIYPEDRGQNYSIVIGERAADLALADAGGRAP